ncbi:hypothetical protein B0H10DRAFT_1941670 [Mycena sp. CBHHK59/15]|nr:hypothetical protein B0H10DRAFT_1941670 [Mycena sp. CBHHK59/15]
MLSICQTALLTSHTTCWVLSGWPQILAKFQAFKSWYLEFTSVGPKAIYDNVREFHASKGFDPYSQHVARRLGCPLYIIPEEMRKPRQDENIVFQDCPCTEDKVASVITLAQELETSWMNGDDLLALICLFKDDAEAAEVYNSLKLECLRVKWVQRKLGLL